ncbi:hypothetical protein OAJ57_04180 [Alphaproteobacteria bacterium]|nr:hypothetical protein [Alphaproteobacteria bacterium]
MHDDHIVTLIPIHWGRHLRLGGGRDGIEASQDLIEIVVGGHRIGHYGLDLLVEPNDEDRTRCGVVGRRAVFRRVAGSIS